MGLLDDAIRQHLELKRAHGADPSDVAKLEHEAFGPIEREDALAVEDAAPAAEDGIAAEEELAYEESELEAEQEWAAAPPAAPRPVADVPPDLPPAPPAEPVADVAPAPVAPPEPLRPGGSVRLDDVGERTRAAAPAPGPQPDGEPGEHDELEETPEFLQETPEHDRLWFEQKPPRDFDF